VPLRLQPCGVIVHRAADLVEHILQLRGLRERTLPGLMARGMPGQLMRSHIDYGAMTVELLMDKCV
jgi:hypothetical protein